MTFDLKIESGDLKIQNGDFQKVTDTEKLIQDILKICLTGVGSNQMSPWYGSFLSRTLIGSPLNQDIILTAGKSQLYKALENLKDLQAAQVKGRQRLSAEEQIASIANIEIFRDQTDLRRFNVNVTVISKGLRPVSTSFKVSTI